MTTTKRIIPMLAGAALLGVLLTGCGNEDATRPPVSPDPSGSALHQADIGSYLMEVPAVYHAAFSKYSPGLPGNFQSVVGIQVTTDDPATLAATIQYASRLFLAVNPKTSTGSLEFDFTYATGTAKPGCGIDPRVIAKALTSLGATVPPDSKVTPAPGNPWVDVTDGGFRTRIQVDLDGVSRVDGTPPIAFPEPPAILKATPPAPTATATATCQPPTLDPAPSPTQKPETPAPAPSGTSTPGPVV